MLAVDEHVQAMSIEERRVIAKPTKVLEDILLQEDDPKKFIRIETSMKEKRSRTSSRS